MNAHLSVLFLEQIINVEFKQHLRHLFLEIYSYFFLFGCKIISKTEATVKDNNTGPDIIRIASPKMVAKGLIISMYNIKGRHKIGAKE